MKCNEGCFTIIFIIIIFTFIILFNYAADLISCNAKANSLGYKCEYHIFSGCVLTKPNGKKVLLEQLRDFEGE